MSRRNSKAAQRRWGSNWKLHLLMQNRFPRFFPDVPPTQVCFDRRRAMRRITRT